MGKNKKSGRNERGNRQIVPNNHHQPQLVSCSKLKIFSNAWPLSQQRHLYFWKKDAQRVIQLLQEMEHVK